MHAKNIFGRKNATRNDIRCVDTTLLEFQCKWTSHFCTQQACSSYARQTIVL